MVAGDDGDFPTYDRSPQQQRKKTVNADFPTYQMDDSDDEGHDRNGRVGGVPPGPLPPPTRTGAEKEYSSGLQGSQNLRQHLTGGLPPFLHGAGIAAGAIDSKARGRNRQFTTVTRSMAQGPGRGVDTAPLPSLSLIKPGLPAGEQRRGHMIGGHSHTRTYECEGIAFAALDGEIARVLYTQLIP